MSTPTVHPPDTRQLETVLPRLRLHERLALRIAVRALLRLDREQDRETLLRRHELVLANERRRAEIERSLLLRRPW
ncbi:MAG: hypothetical protein BGO95_03095 [Micrococcales bacterium 73-13]|nr:MAG: hypothetical protein BGO95_03095 [Micrococcales bacterium 73-13]